MNANPHSGSQPESKDSGAVTQRRKKDQSIFLDYADIVTNVISSNCCFRKREFIKLHIAEDGKTKKIVSLNISYDSIHATSVSNPLCG